MALRDLENRMEKLFSKPFSKTFKNPIEPTEIAAQLTREMDLARRLSPRGPISPNAFSVWLCPDDARIFAGFQKALLAELEESVRQYAIEEGYNFVGPVKVEIFVDDNLKMGSSEVRSEFVSGEAQPRLLCNDGRTFAIGARALVIGRSPEADVVINDANASRNHAEVWRTAEGIAVRDLQSTNGTFVNGHRITAVSLSPKDEIAIGGFRFRIELA